MKSISEYAKQLVAPLNLQIKSGQLFAKVLTSNDDSGRHGVLIPTDVYSFFPHLEIIDPDTNVTRTFTSFDAISRKTVELAFKYYQRYPERRITRVNSIVNDHQAGLRLQIVLRVEVSDGQVTYVHDAANQLGDNRFDTLWDLFTGSAVKPTIGAYIVVPVEYTGLTVDDPLEDLLSRFDTIRGRWFDTLRSGDTGIGYTFETLVGVEENNDQTADFRGIELKCKQRKGNSNSPTGKLNLFQLAPVWSKKQTAVERLVEIGQSNLDGLYSCYSQVNTTPNNLLLALSENSQAEQLDLQKGDLIIGHWPHATLEKRLLEKHSRAAFIFASVSKTKSVTKYCYEELIYCEQPAIDRFLELTMKNQLVFEFLMSEKTKGKVRNHGYPWRLVREDLLDQLFSVRAKLR
jgi:MvaI/BcnI restriction endonuclease family